MSLAPGFDFETPLFYEMPIRHVLDAKWDMHVVKDLFSEWPQHCSQHVQHAMSLVRDVQAGRDNDPCIGTRMRVMGTGAEPIRPRFKVCAQRLRLASARERLLDTTLARPSISASGELQLQL